MIRLTLSRRRTVRFLCRIATAVSALMLLVAVAGTRVSPASAAITSSGVVTIKDDGGNAVLSGGGSATVFTMLPPSGAACPGSGAGTPSYRWQTFLVDAGVDPSTVAYASGPKTITGHIVFPMFDAVGNPVQNQNPSASPLGLIAGIPTVSFGWAVPGDIPPGDYRLGFACTKAGATVSFWSAAITVVTNAADVPAHFTWTVATTPPPPPATDPTTAAPTTTIAATTTTVHATTTTSASSTSTTTATTGAVTTTTAFASSATPTTNSTIASTGTASSTVIIWAVLLLLFGRFAILLARPVRSVTDEER